MEIREAMEKAAAGETPEPVVEQVDVQPASEPAAEAPAAVEAPAKAEGQPRKPDGKFDTKPKDAPQPAEKPVTTKTPEPVKGPTTATPTPTTPEAPSVAVKAPQSWKPQAREAFAKAPPEVQAEVTRREAEITRALQDTAAERQLAQRTREALSPYEGIARANGMDALSLANSTLQTVSVLQMGSQQQKAAALAQVIRAYGVDVESLAAALDGQPMAPQQAQQQPVNIQAEVQRVIQAERQQAAASHADAAVRTFMNTQPEFLQDVWQDMQAVLLAAAQSPDPSLRNMTPEQAYDRAVWMNPHLRDVLMQRKAAEAAKSATASTERSRAAVTPKSQPAPSPSGGHPKGIRAAMEAAAEKIGFTG